MNKYVDGFLVPVPKENLGAYREMAQVAGKVWREYGALEYVECVAEDVKPGEEVSFFDAVKLKENEVLCFSYIVYKDRASRDEINKKVMEDPRICSMDPNAMPFDFKRMLWGGFSSIVAL